MTFEKKLRHGTADALWQEHCGFLDFSLEEYILDSRPLMTRLGRVC